jgi:hypothetical protein
MPEFKETPNENPGLPQFDPELVAKLKALDLGRKYRESTFHWGSSPENQELSQSAENLNEPEVEPSFTSSEDKLTRLLDGVYGREGIDNFKELVSGMDAAATSEQDKEDIRHFGEYHLWAMGEHEGPPPESVVVVRDEYSSLLTVEPNPQIFTDADEDRIIQKYNAASDFNYGVHWKRAGALMQMENQAEVVDGLAEIVADSPAYKFLESLTIENPSNPEDRPLNIFEKAARQSQAEQETQRQFGMSPNDNVKLNPNAARALQRENFSIDEERVTAKSIQPADSSPEPIRSYFVDVMRRKVVNDWGFSDFGDEPMELTVSDSHGIVLRPENSELHKSVGYTFNPNLIVEDVSETFKSEGLDAWLDRQVVEETLSVLTDDRGFESSDEILQFVRRRAAARVVAGATRAHSAPHLTRSLNGIKVYSREDYDREEKVHNQHRKTLEKAEEPTRNSDLYDYGLSGFPEMRTSGLHTNENPADFNVDDSFCFKDRESMEADKRKIAGDIIGFQPDGAKRLIQTEAKNLALPPANGSADLTFITDKSSGFSNQQPQIPGYMLTGRTQNVYEFVKAPSDPYMSCDVEISFANREILAEEYQALGLDNLSREVMRGEQFTVSNLATVIKDNGNYFTPPEPVLISDNPDFGDFQDFIVGEKLQLQCSGASHFLNLSLNKIFGEDSSEVISGLSFDSNGQVSLGSAHAQTGFEHDGRRYILDATPSSELSVGRELTHTSPETIVERTPEEKLEQQFNLLEKQLCNIFKAPDALALHTHLSALPNHDPSRQALEILAGLKSGQDTEDYLEYIDSITRAATTKDPRLKQLGIGDYSGELLNLLSEQIKKAQGLLAQIGK